MSLPTVAPHCSTFESQATPELLDDSIPTRSLLFIEASVATVLVTFITTSYLGTFPYHFAFIVSISITALLLGVQVSTARKRNMYYNGFSQWLYHGAFLGEVLWALTLGPFSAGDSEILLMLMVVLFGAGSVKFMGLIYLNMTLAASGVDDPAHPGLVVGHKLYRWIRDWKWVSWACTHQYEQLLADNPDEEEPKTLLEESDLDT